MEGRRHVVSSINLVAWNGTGYGFGVAEPRHSSREGLGLDVRLVALS